MGMAWLGGAKKISLRIIQAPNPESNSRPMKQSWWHQYHSRIQQAPDLENLHKLCCSIFQQWNIDHFLLLAGQFTTPDQAGLSALSGLPDKLWLQLQQADHFQNDPTLQHARHSSLPLFWSELEERTSNKPVKGEWNFLAAARAQQLDSGLSIPVHGPAGLFGVLTLANRSDQPQAEKSLQLALPKASLLAAPLITALLRFSGDIPQPPASLCLTGREKDCLLWTAKGKTSWEISSILHIGERTVIYHLANVLRKLGAANRQQAVAIGCVLGLLGPELSLNTPASESDESLSHLRQPVD